MLALLGDFEDQRNLLRHPTIVCLIGHKWRRLYSYSWYLFILQSSILHFAALDGYFTWGSCCILCSCRHSQPTSGCFTLGVKSSTYTNNSQYGLLIELSKECILFSRQYSVPDKVTTQVFFPKSCDHLVPLDKARPPLNIATTSPAFTRCFFLYCSQGGFERSITGPVLSKRQLVMELFVICLFGLLSRNT